MTHGRSSALLQGLLRTWTVGPATLPGMGIHVYGLAALAFGAIGLVSGDFAAVWQPVPAEFPARTALAYVTASVLLACGAGIQRRQTARWCLPLVALAYAFPAFFWLRRVVWYPHIIGTWLGFAEQLALILAAGVAFAGLAPSSPWSAPLGRAMRVLFGLCAMTFGLAHVLSLPETVRMVPAWLPPSQTFWAIATGVFHFAAGLAIATGVQARLASRLLTAMILGFGALVWAPSLAANPASHLVWCGNAINLAVAGAAWIMTDATLTPSAKVSA